MCDCVCEVTSLVGLWAKFKKDTIDGLEGIKAPQVVHQEGMQGVLNVPASVGLPLERPQKAFLWHQGPSWVSPAQDKELTRPWR